MCATNAHTAARLLSEETGWAWGVYSPDLLRLEIGNNAYYVAFTPGRTVADMVAEFRGLRG